MTGDEFSKLIHVDRTTLSKWENDDDSPGDQSDRLIRAMSLGLGEGLREKVEEVMRKFADIQGSGGLEITLDPKHGDYVYA
jgi:transcriptional regulator with XRE-family HTH domain